MTKKCFLLYAFICFYTNIAFCHNGNYDISPSTELPQVGWNKVLCISNGGTVLLHMEPGKKIIIKTYDSLHKPIASQSHACRLTDIYILKDVVFKGFYDINGEAVLFLEQQHLGKYQLIRLRFNATSGDLVEEKLMGESPGLTKRIRFFVAVNKAHNNYAVLSAMALPQFQEYTMSVAVYNSEHVRIKEIPLEIEQKTYDNMQVMGIEYALNGLCVSADLSVLVSNGTSGSSMSGSMGSETIYSHVLKVFYIHNDSAIAKAHNVDITANNIYPYYTHYTYNSFANTLNLLMLSLKPILYRFGYELRPANIMANLFLKMDQASMETDYNWVVNQYANKYLKQKTDSTQYYEGIPVKLYTNENGLTTVFSESYERLRTPQSNVRNNNNTYFGPIAVTQLDDDGNEIWGTILPGVQCYTSLSQYYDPYVLAKGWQNQVVFNDLPPQVYNRQFVSYNACMKNKEYYIIYNDYSSNFNNSVENPGDTVTNFNIANAFYYKMNRKKEITKNYLFGSPQEHEYVTCFIEGADYDEKRGVYAALVQQRKDDHTELCMAWKQLN